MQDQLGDVTISSSNRLSLSAAAKALGMTPRTISAYGTGARPVPRYVALACKGWEVEQRQRGRKLAI